MHVNVHVYTCTGFWDLLNWFGYSGEQVADLLLATRVILLQQLLVQPVRVAHTWNRIGDLGNGRMESWVTWNGKE